MKIPRAINIFVPERRKLLFRDKVLSYLKSGIPLNIPDQGRFYVVVENAHETSNFFFYEISVIFHLESVEKHKPIEANPESWFLALKEMSETYSFEVRPDSSHHGEQRFLFSFTDRKNVEKNIDDLKEFIRETYESSELIRKRNYYFWEELGKRATEKTTGKVNESSKIERGQFKKLEEKAIQEKISKGLSPAWRLLIDVGFAAIVSVGIHEFFRVVIERQNPTLTKYVVFYLIQITLLLIYFKILDRRRRLYTNVVQKYLDDDHTDSVGHEKDKLKE